MPYVIVAPWRPRDGERDRIEAILRELVSEVRKEPGNHGVRGATIERRSVRIPALRAV
jgi:quinol monooxygenase YgiN